MQQKVDTKSSTEVKLVAIDDEMRQIFCRGYLLTTQGHYFPTMTRQLKR